MTPWEATAVVLAAGRGRRMGGPKALVPYADGTLLAAHLACFRALGMPRVIVVVSAADDARIRRALPAQRDLALEWAVNQAPRRGPFSSVILGLTVWARGARSPGGCVLTPVDVPPVDEAVHHALGAALDPEACAAVPEWNGRGGHPVWLTPRGVERVLRHPGSPAHARLDELFAQWGSTVRRVPVKDDGVLRNWNTPADLADV